MLFRVNLYYFTLVGFMQLFLATALLLSPARRISRRGSGSRFSEVLFSSIGSFVHRGASVLARVGDLGDPVDLAGASRRQRSC